jgi:hypothetical protein
MKKVYSRGMQAANKHVLMAALCYNLKKLLKFERKRPKNIALAMRKADALLNFLICSVFLGYFKPQGRHLKNPQFQLI